MEIVFFLNLWERTVTVIHVNSRFYDRAENTRPSKLFHLSAPRLLTTHRLPRSSSLPTSPLPSQACDTCDLRDEGEFTWNSNTHLVLFVPNWWRRDCIPTDLVIKGGRAAARARDGGGREENGSAAFSSAGSPSGRHRSSDVTNAANVLACSRCGLLERAEPLGALLPVSSPAHLRDSCREAI